MKNSQMLECLLESGKIPHALLFAGPKGAGKKHAALQFASSLLQSQKKVDHHPDVHHFVPEGKTGMHPITSIRKLIHDAYLAPFEAAWKIFILQDAEKMLPTSSNALLKILEEPPSQTLILLLTEYPDRLLPTILSRCQMVTFIPGNEKNIDAQMLALLAEGTPISQVAEFESEHPDAVFETLLFWYRDRVLLEMGGEEKLLHFPDYLEQLKNTTCIPLDKVEQGVRQARLAFERSTKLSLCIEMFFHYIK